MKKKCLAILLSLALSIGIPFSSVVAEDNITVALNGETIQFDVPPQLIENRTMVPLRKIFESMGAIVEWNNETQTVTATKGNDRVIATVNNKNVYINGETKVLDVPPMIVDERTLVPTRFVAEAFGADVGWNEENKTVEINFLKNNQSVSFNIQEFTNNFELADFSKYNSFASDNGLGGTKIYITAVLDKVEAFDAGESFDMLIGYFTDINSNKWYGMLSTTLTDSLSDYDNFIGKDLVVCGVYEGYSGKLKMPSIQLYKMADIGSGTIKTGLAKTMEYLDLIADSDSTQIQKKSVNQAEYDFTSTSGIESYLYEKYETLDSDIGKWTFEFSVSDYGYFSEDFSIDIKAYGPDLGLLFDFDEVVLGNYSDSEIENGKKQLKTFMKNLAVDLIDKMPNKKITGSYHDSYYRYPNLKMDLIIEDYCTWANYDRGNKGDDASISIFRWLPNLDGRVEY